MIQKKKKKNRNATFTTMKISFLIFVQIKTQKLDIVVKFYC